MKLNSPSSYIESFHIFSKTNWLQLQVVLIPRTAFSNSKIIGKWIKAEATTRGVL